MSESARPLVGQADYSLPKADRTRQQSPCYYSKASMRLDLDNSMSPDGTVANPDDISAPAMNTRVLVVDDDVSVRESLGRALKLENYEAVLAANGDEALQKFCEGYIDVVLLDLNMPVKNGWDAFERM